MKSTYTNTLWLKDYMHSNDFSTAKRPEKLKCKSNFILGMSILFGHGWEGEIQ